MNDVKQIENEVEKFKRNLVGFDGMLEALKSANVKLSDFSIIGKRHLEEYESTSSNFRQIKDELLLEMQNHRIILEKYVDQIALIKSLLTNEEFVRESINNAFSQNQADLNELEKTIVNEISELNIAIDREIKAINNNMENLDLTPIKDNLESVKIDTINIENKLLELFDQLNIYFTKIQGIISSSDQSLKTISDKVDLFYSKVNGRLNLLLILNCICMILILFLLLGK